MYAYSVLLVRMRDAICFLFGIYIAVHNKDNQSLVSLRVVDVFICCANLIDVSATTLHWPRDGMSTPQESTIPVGPSAPATSPLGVLGNMNAFNPKTDNVSTYLEQLQLYFEANRVEDNYCGAFSFL